MEDLTREFLLESHEGLDRMERCLTQLTDAPADPELLREIFRAVHTIKGTTGFFGFRRLERVAHAGESLLARLRDGEIAVSAALIDVLLLLLDTLRGILRGIEQQDCEPEGEDASLLAQLEALQVPSPVPEPVPSPAPEPASESVLASQPVATPAVAAIASPDPVSRDAGGSVVDSTVRVDVDVLQRLMNLAGELVLTRNQIVVAAGEGPLSALAQRLDRVTGEMRDAVMRVRMQPVEQVFSRFPRLVRELARQCGKQVHLEMEGQQTRLDRSVLELMRDPLLHAVRNAIDHGIEASEVRSANGKPAEGHLRLRAASVGEHVLIEIIDDGGGIAPDSMRQHAIRKGLISAEQAAALTDVEARNLVFLPGFSTAAQVTNVSGRGVGLDVVRQNVERVGGSAVLESADGVGTTLRLRLPLTLAILPALIVRCVGQRFALPQTVVEEMHRLHSAEQIAGIESLGTAQLYRLRDHLLPLADLRALLHLGVPPAALLSPEALLSREAPSFQKDDYNFVVLNTEGRCFCLRVDAFEGTEELVAKPLDRITEVPIFSGAAQLADGDIALILDAAVLADLAGISADRAAVLAETLAALPVGESYLHIALRDVPAAIRIEHVEHVVSVQASDIQSLRGVLALHLDDDIVPLLDGVRSARGQDIEAIVPATSAPAHTWQVLICSHAEGRMGLLVSAVYGMVQAEAHSLKNVAHPEEPERSILRLGEDLVRVIDPMEWRDFANHPETWTALDSRQWQEIGSPTSTPLGTEAHG